MKRNLTNLSGVALAAVGICIVAPLYFGVTSPWAFLVQCLLSPVAYGFAGIVAQLYYKECGGGARYRSVTLAVAAAATLFGIIGCVHIATVRGKKYAAYAAINVWFLAVLATCILALWRRSVKAYAPLPASSTSSYCGASGTLENDSEAVEDEDAMNDSSVHEDASLLDHSSRRIAGASSIRGANSTRNTNYVLGAALVVPTILLLASVLFPSYFYLDRADHTVGWGPNALVWVPALAGDTKLCLALHYTATLAFLALCGGLLSASSDRLRRAATPPQWVSSMLGWSEREGAGRVGVLLLAVAVTVAVAFSHWRPYSSDGAWRRWSCSLGPEACASGWLIWYEGDNVFWAEGFARALGQAALVVLGALCLPLGKSAGLGNAAPGNINNSGGSNSSSSSNGCLRKAGDNMGGGVEPSTARRFHAWCGSVFLALVLLHVALFARSYRFYDTWPSDLWKPYPDYAPTNGTVFLATVVTLLLTMSAAVLPADGADYAAPSDLSRAFCTGDRSSHHENSDRSKESSSGKNSNSRSLNRGGRVRRLLSSWGLSPTSVAKVTHTCLGVSLLLAVCVHAKGGWPFALLGLALMACDAIVRTHRTARLVRLVSASLLPTTPSSQRETLQQAQELDQSGRRHNLSSSSMTNSGAATSGAPATLVSSADLAPRLLRVAYTVERYRGGLGRLPPWLARRLPSAWKFSGKGSSSSAIFESTNGGGGNSSSSSSSSRNGSTGRLWEPWEPLRVAGPGQWVFLNCPEVSVVEWFPVFLSSAPGDAVSTHHLPLSGHGSLSWPDRFAALAAGAGEHSGANGHRDSNGHKAHGPNLSDKSRVVLYRGLTLNVDGPYGPARDFERSGARRVMLVGAGAGVGPAHAHFRHMYLKARQAAYSANGHSNGLWNNINSSPADSRDAAVGKSGLDGAPEGLFVGNGNNNNGSGSSGGPRVHLMWISRDGAAFTEDPLFVDTLGDVQRDSLGGRFSFSLYATRAGATPNGPAPRSSTGNSPRFQIVAGRPDLATIFSAMGQWQQEERHRSHQPLGSSSQGSNGGSDMSRDSDRNAEGTPPALVYASGPPSLLRECAFHSGRCGLRLLEDPYPHLWPEPRN